MSLALCPGLSSIGTSDVIEIEDEVLVTACKRARQLVAQDQEIGDEPRLYAVAIHPMVGGKRRDRAQDCSPLKIVERASDTLMRRQQQVVFHIKDARCVVGALDVYAKPGKPVGIVAQHGAIGGAVESQRAFLHPA